MDFNQHVIQSQFPYSQQSQYQMNNFVVNRRVKCDKCGDVVEEHQFQNHMKENHLTMTCPPCKSKHEARIDVEDHIINEHAAHFMSMLTTISGAWTYRRIWVCAVWVRNSGVFDQGEGRGGGEEEGEREKMFKEQANYLAGLKGMNMFYYQIIYRLWRQNIQNLNAVDFFR